MYGLLASSHSENGEVMTVANRTYAEERVKVQSNLIYDVGMNDGVTRPAFCIKVTVCWLLKPTRFSPQRQSCRFQKEI